MKSRFANLTLLLLTGLLWSGILLAQADPLQEAENTANLLNDHLSALTADPAAEPDQFAAIKRAARLTRLALQREQERLIKASETYQNDLNSLGEAQKDDSANLVEARAGLKTRIDAASRQRAHSAALLLRYDHLFEQANQLEQEKLSQRLLARGDTAVTAVYASLKEPRGMIETASALLASGIGWSAFSFWHLVVAAGLLVFGASSSWYWRRRHARMPMESDQVGVLPSLRIAATCSIQRRGPLILGLLLAALYLYLIPTAPADAVVTRLLLAMAVYLALAGVITVMLSPCAPATLILPIDAGLSRSLARRLRLLALLSLSAWVLFASNLVSDLPPPHQLMIRTLFASLWLGNGLLVVWIIGRIHDNRHFLLIRLLYSLALVVAFLAELIGYRSLAEFMAVGLLVSYLAVGIGLIANVLLASWFDDIDNDSWQPAQGLRSKLAIQAGTPLPGMIWLRLTTTLLLWGGVAYLVALAWGLASTGVDVVSSFVSEGFNVGSVAIVPNNLLLAILVFVVAWQVSVWIKQTLMPRWLKRTRLDKGARNAVVTLGGYLGIIIAALLGLTFAGLDFGKFAIIAGALSVGIGFGLQNIVNNFVSGLILLFERPIRVGDWIVIGSTEGYVRRISIRSTQIETFDRADIIVPNSELISSNVTNWMLRDPFGRVIVPVGVAYGSDTELVKKLLMNVAAGHPLVMMNDSRVSNPRVLFRSFGDSSLNFELRCFISDIESRISTLSDLNFAIDKTFRENGVAIPFPQRDVHMIPQQDPGSNSSI